MQRIWTLVTLVCKQRTYHCDIHKCAVSSFVTYLLNFINPFVTTSYTPMRTGCLFDFKGYNINTCVQFVTCAVLFCTSLQHTHGRTKSATLVFYFVSYSNISMWCFNPGIEKTRFLMTFLCIFLRNMSNSIGYRLIFVMLGLSF